MGPIRISPGARVTLRWWALAGLLVAEVMNLLDSTITVVVAPLIGADLHGDTAGTQWVVAAYTLPFAVLLILGGRLGDMAGRRRMFLIGALGFLAASLACAFAPSMSVLLTARAVQGGMAALVIPQTIGLIKITFTGAELPRALSFIGPLMGLTAVAGPVLGGLLAQADIAGMSWRAVFLVNVPLGILVLATVPLLQEDRAPRSPGVDLVGLALAAVAGAGFVVPTINGANAGWPAWTWVAFAAAAVASALLALHVRRAGRAGRDCIVEPSLFHDRGFPAALSIAVTYFAVSTGVVFVAVLFMENGLHADALAASLTVLPFSVGLAIASLIAGQILVPRYGGRMMLPGIALLAAGLLLTLAAALTIRDDAYPWLLSSGLGLAGLGGGLTTVPFFTMALLRVRPHETGSASGLLNAFQQLGGTLGIATLGTLASIPAAAATGLALAVAAAAILSLVILLSARVMLITQGP